MNYIAPRAEPLIREIPLGRLALAPENVRKTPPDPRADAELRASIAALGLLENLVVRTDTPGEDGADRYWGPVNELAVETGPVEPTAVESSASDTGPYAPWRPGPVRVAGAVEHPTPLVQSAAMAAAAAPASSPGAPPKTWSRSACSNGRCATARSSGMRRRPGSSGAVLLPHRERGVRPAAPVDWSEGLKFYMVTSGIGAAAFLCPSGHRMGLLQDSNPRVSSALIARFERTGSHESQDHWNDKRTLVALTLDEGRSSWAGGAGLRDSLGYDRRSRPRREALGICFSSAEGPGVPPFEQASPRACRPDPPSC